MYTSTHQPKYYASRTLKFATAALASIALCVPLAAARADDDDWDDRWEDYQEELEDRREEAHERWEERQEAYEEWREDRREALEDRRERFEDRRERQIIVPRYGRRYDRPRSGYWEEPLPPPRYYYDDRYGDRYYDGGTVYREYDWDQPRVYRHYRTYRPEYRYYGTPGIGYSEYGRQRSVQVGPIRVFWRR